MTRTVRSMRSKNAMVDTQFHWLFVLLAGGFILLLFAIFIGQGIAANQEKQTALMLEYFDNVFTSSQNLQHLDESVDSLSSIDIKQDCEPGVESRLQFVGESLDKKTTYLPIFSAKDISGTTYAVKTLPYDAPFHIDNPLYLTDSQTLYIVYSDDADVRDRYAQLLPSHATKVETDDLSTVKLTGFKNVVIITSDEGSSTISGQITPPDIAKLPANLQNANLRHADVVSGTKTVDYYYAAHTNNGVILLAPPDNLLPNDGDISSVTYFDDASLLGAIMSDDPLVYECNIQKLGERARAVALQIAVRAQTLASTPNMDGRCVGAYNSAASSIFTALTDSTTDDLASPDWQNSLATNNDQLIKWSCPALY